MPKRREYSVQQMEEMEQTRANQKDMRIDAMLNDLEYEKGEQAHASNFILLQSAVISARSSRNSAASLALIADSLAELVARLKEADKQSAT